MRKGSQIELLKEKFKNRTDVIFTREPGGGYVAEQIRRIILDNNSVMHEMCEFLLFSASRVQHLYDVILPALAKNQIVFCERFWDSSIAYQGHARGIDLDKILTISKIVTDDLEPDITLFFNLPADIAFKRITTRGELDRMEKEGESFQRKVYDGYQIAAEMFKHRFINIDASSTVSEVHKNVMKALQAKNITP